MRRLTRILPVVPGYRVLEAFGRERVGFTPARLFLAEPEDRPGSRVVIKDFFAAVAPHPESAKDCRRRAARADLIGKALHHPNIARTDRLIDERYLPMEWLPGPNLRQLLRRGPIATADAARILLQVGDALVHLNERMTEFFPERANAGHGDLDLLNIVVVDTPAGVCAKLVDLDETGRYLPSGKSAEEACARWFRSVDIYCSKPPEFMLEAVPYLDSRSNVFSFGVIAFCLLAQDPPYTGPDEYRQCVRRLLAEGNGAEGRGLGDLVPSRVGAKRATPLGRVLARMTQFSRARRHPSMRAALEELAPHLRRLAIGA
jgi:serine/threonine protein kinase